MITQQRIIDTFFPVMRGGVLHSGSLRLRQNGASAAPEPLPDVDIVIITACGERAGRSRGNAPRIPRAH